MTLDAVPAADCVVGCSHPVPRTCCVAAQVLLLLAVTLSLSLTQPSSLSGCSHTLSLLNSKLGSALAVAAVLVQATFEGIPLVTSQGLVTLPHDIPEGSEIH